MQAAGPSAAAILGAEETAVRDVVEVVERPEMRRPPLVDHPLNHARCVDVFHSRIAFEHGLDGFLVGDLSAVEEGFGGRRVAVARNEGGVEAGEVGEVADGGAAVEGDDGCVRAEDSVPQLRRVAADGSVPAGKRHGTRAGAVFGDEAERLAEVSAVVEVVRVWILEPVGRRDPRVASGHFGARRAGVVGVPAFRRRHPRGGPRLVQHRFRVHDFDVERRKVVGRLQEDGDGWMPGQAPALRADAFVGDVVLELAPRGPVLPSIAALNSGHGDDAEFVAHVVELSRHEHSFQANRIQAHTADHCKLLDGPRFFDAHQEVGGVASSPDEDWGVVDVELERAATSEARLSGANSVAPCLDVLVVDANRGVEKWLLLVLVVHLEWIPQGRIFGEHELGEKIPRKPDALLFVRFKREGQFLLDDDVSVDVVFAKIDFSKIDGNGDGISFDFLKSIDIVDGEGNI